MIDSICEWPSLESAAHSCKWLRLLCASLRYLTTQLGAALDESSPTDRAPTANTIAGVSTSSGAQESSSSMSGVVGGQQQQTSTSHKSLTTTLRQPASALNVALAFDTLVALLASLQRAFTRSLAPNPNTNTSAPSTESEAEAQRECGAAESVAEFEAIVSSKALASILEERLLDLWHSGHLEQRVLVPRYLLELCDSLSLSSSAKSSDSTSTTAPNKTPAVMPLVEQSAALAPVVVALVRQLAPALFAFLLQSLQSRKPARLEPSSTDDLALLDAVVTLMTRLVALTATDNRMLQCSNKLVQISCTSCRSTVGLL